jgi:hypothetical protein
MATIEARLTRLETGAAWPTHAELEAMTNAELEAIIDAWPESARTIRAMTNAELEHLIGLTPAAARAYEGTMANKYGA